MRDTDSGEVEEEDRRKYRATEDRSLYLAAH